jgi:PhzF family phenazine biosynthesis protein
VREVRFRQVDVFTRTPFRGNPVAVVLDAQGLDGAEMQRIAAWTNLSETTFVPGASRENASYRLRIFTPRAELPFAGHPTIGSAHAVLEAGLVEPKAGRFTQECAAGVLELEREDGGRIWVRAPAARAKALPDNEIARLEKAISRSIRARPLIVDVGPVWLIADLGCAEEVDALKPNLPDLAGMSNSLGLSGVTVFGAATGGAAMHVRSFAPAHGIAEDPVCGSGNVAVAAYLARSGNPFGARYEARQGMALGRDGRVSIRIEGDAIFLGGHAVTCVEGSLRAS